MWAEEWDCSSPELRLLPQHMYSSLPSLRGAVHHLGKGHSRDLSHIHNVLEFTLLPQSSEFYLYEIFCASLMFLLNSFCCGFVCIWLKPSHLLEACSVWMCMRYLLNSCTTLVSCTYGVWRSQGSVLCGLTAAKLGISLQSWTLSPAKKQISQLASHFLFDTCKQCKLFIR